MATETLRRLADAGLSVRLNATGDGLRGTAAARAVVGEDRDALVTALAAERDHRPAIAALLRELRHSRSEQAPNGLTLELNATMGIEAKPSRRLLTAEQAATVVALRDPLGTYLLTRQLFAKADVALRVEPMSRQVKAWDEAGKGAEGAPFLRLPKLPERRLDACVSCGEPLAHDPGWDGTADKASPLFGRYIRCSDCRAAVAAVLGTERRETECWCRRPYGRYMADGAPVCEVHGEIVACPRCYVRPVDLACGVEGNRGRLLYRTCRQCFPSERGVA